MTTSAAAAAAPVDQIRVERRGDLLELRWADAEERLQGTIHPALPRAGEPFIVSLHVGNFQGAEFDGPLTLTFHQPGAPALVTRTLTRQGVNWHTELTPDAAGPWELEVRYRHTHQKVLTARISVVDQPLPRGLGWGLITLAAGTALVLGMRGVLRRIRTQASEPGRRRWIHAARHARRPDASGQRAGGFGRGAGPRRGARAPGGSTRHPVSPSNRRTFIQARLPGGVELSFPLTPR
ncbi:hypothetical protein ACLESD_30725 [Pyxidicoccus sp. 3LFB2]